MVILLGVQGIFKSEPTVKDQYQRHLKTLKFLPGDFEITACITLWQ